MTLIKPIKKYEFELGDYQNPSEMYQAVENDFGLLLTTLLGCAIGLLCFLFIVRVILQQVILKNALLFLGKLQTYVDLEWATNWLTTVHGRGSTPTLYSEVGFVIVFEHAELNFCNRAFSISNETERSEDWLVERLRIGRVAHRLFNLYFLQTFRPSISMAVAVSSLGELTVHIFSCEDVNLILIWLLEYEQIHWFLKPYDLIPF